MRKLKLSVISLLLVCSLTIPSAQSAEAKKTKAKKVYYVPGSSYAYHATKNCTSLRRTKKSKIKSISLKKAKAKGLRACKMKNCR